jgi:hypothetical protein
MHKYPQHIHTTALGALTLLLCAIPLMHAAVVPEQFHHQRTLTAQTTQEEIAAAPLDGSSWEEIKPGATDLRVVNQDNAFVPHLMRRASAKRVRRMRVRCPASIQTLREHPDNRITFDLKLSDANPSADTLVFDTPLKNFERLISIDGVTKENIAQPLVAEALIYDYTRFMDVRHVSVALPRNDYPILRVTIDAVTDTTQSPRAQITRTLHDSNETQRTETTTETTRPFRIDAARLFTHKDLPSNRETTTIDYPIAKWTSREDSKHNTTVIELTTRNIPLTELAISTDTRNFSRRATLEVPYRRDGREQWRTIAATTLSRVSFREFTRATTALSFTETQTTRLRLTLHNGDAPPLHISALTGRGPQWQALFLAAPENSYRLLLTSANATPPAYDTAHLAQLLERDITPTPFNVGPLTKNPDYNPKAGRGTSTWVGSKTLFIIGIILVVAILGIGLLRASKTALTEQ